MPVTIAAGPPSNRAARTFWRRVGVPAEEEDDSGEGPLPGPALEAPVVDGAFGPAGSNELPGGGDAFGEGGAEIDQ